MTVVLRKFVASRTVIVVVELTAEMDRAMDVLQGAGVLDDKKVELLVAAERAGQDVVKFAHHLVSLASAVRR